MALSPEEKRELEEREQFEKRFNALQAERLSLSSAYNDSVKELLGVQSKRATFDSNILKINRQINIALFNSRNEFQSLNGLQKEIVKNEETISKARNVAKGIGDSIGAQDNKRVQDALKNNRLLSEAIEYQKELEDLLEKGKTLTDDGRSVAVQLKFAQDEIALLDAKNDKLQLGLSQLEKTYLFTQANADQLERQNQQLANNAKTLSGIGNFADGFSKIPFIGNAMSDAFKQTSQEINNGTINTKKFGAVNLNFAKNIGKNLKSSFGPAFIIFELFKGFLEADKQATELAKSQALSKAEAASFRQELADAAAQSGDLFVTSTKLVKSFNELNKQFGFITNFSTQTLVTVTKLTEKVGLAADAAGNLAAASSLNGESLDSNFKNVLATSYELQRQAGVQFDLREITNEVGKTSGQIRANLAANPSAIAKAVTQAKLLGGELDDIKTISAALLDFESSISNELQAELLTGKALNLERARFAALNGDVATVAKEINNQVGNFSDFTKLNVIQQDALAASVGLTSDRLSDILFQQEVQGKNAKELRALGKEELANRLEQTTIQDKFNATVEKLQAIFADVGSALVPIIDLLGLAFKIVNLIVAPVTDLLNALTGIVTLGVGGKFSLDNTLSAYGLADDAEFPSGYGKRVLYNEGEITAFNDDDNIVATTNEIKPISSVQPQVNVQPTEVNIDTDSLKEQMKMQTKVLEKILNKEGQVSIDSSKAGRAFTVGTYRMQ